ncbi:MAG: Crp/Fnr family transcriptional regulator [Rhodopila sp.]
MSLNMVDVFKGINAAERCRLERDCFVLEPGDGDAVFSQGDPADAVYAIIAGDGHVRIGSMNRQGKALMVEVFHLGELFGEIGVLDAGYRTASALVEGRIKLVKLPAMIFQAALAQYPDLGMELCRVLARRLRRTFALFQDATFETLEVRLARQILYLAGREGRQTPGGLRLTHRFRQADLADLLGATTRSIITILNAWRAAGYVAYDTDRAMLTVQDILALQAIVEAGSER